MKNKKVEKVNGNIVISGMINLKEDTVLHNIVNNGLSPFDPEWNNNAYITLPKGTEVEYFCIKYPTGDKHVIQYKVRTPETLTGFTTFEATK